MAKQPKKTLRALERKVPEFAVVNRMSKGDETAAAAVADAAEENEVTAPGGLMIRLMKLDMPVYIETPNWIYIGHINEIGQDYIVLRDCSRMIADGRHHTMMRTGTAPGIEIEPSGGPLGVMVIPLDWLGPWCYWPHPMPTAPTAP